MQKFSISSHHLQEGEHDNVNGACGLCLCVVHIYIWRPFDQTKKKVEKKILTTFRIRIIVKNEKEKNPKQQQLPKLTQAKVRIVVLTKCRNRLFAHRHHRHCCCCCCFGCCSFESYTTYDYGIHTVSATKCINRNV